MDDSQIDKIDQALTRQIRNVTIACVVVFVAKDFSQAAAMSLVDVTRRVVDLKMPLKWG